jgi:hypothetical protein
MDDTTKTGLTAIAGSVIGALATLFTAGYKLRKARQIAEEKQREHVRLKILHPLLVASEDLLERITDINRRRRDPVKGSDMQRWFRCIKDKPWQDPGSFAYWANDEGYFAMSTLYITVVYFYYAGTIRRDFPFFELAQGGESTLLSHLSTVRTSLGGKFGIWEALQDSLGAYLQADGTVKDYHQFCDMIISTTQWVWFNRLIDFYRDINLKLDDHLANIEHSLRDLVAFLRFNLGISALEYSLTAESIAELRARRVPVAMVDRLQALVPQDYLNEVDFVAALVGCIGQDLTDDYKPSILKCAKRRLVPASARLPREPGDYPGAAQF